MKCFMTRDLEDLVASITFNSDIDFSINGMRYHFFDAAQLLNTNPLVKSSRAFLALENSLYEIYFCRRPAAALENRRMFNLNTMVDFTTTLSNHNMGTTSWEAGWKIAKMETDGRIVVEKKGLRIWAHGDKVTLCPGVEEMSEGNMVMLQIGKELRYLLHGFYMALSESQFSEVGEDEDNSNNSPLVRIYWNIRPEYSAKLTMAVTLNLNQLLIPFKFKVLNDPFHYPRADAAVLYIWNRDLAEAKEALKKIYREIKNGLNHSTPIFAKTLASGISLAEDPKNGESFGQNRCRLMAEAIRSCNSNKIKDHQEKIREISGYFRERNIDLCRPHLHESTEDFYDQLLGGVFDESKK